MRWMPKTRKVRVIAGAIGALLLLGAIVGSETLDQDAGRLDATRTVQGGAGAFEVSAPQTLSGSAGDPMMSEVQMDASGAMAGGGEGQPQTGSASGSLATPQAQALPPVDAGRVIKTATLRLEVEEDGFDGAREKAVAAAAGFGGFVQNSEVSPTAALLTFRVPADQFEATLEDLRDLGTVKDESVTGQDVTEEYVDLEARLRHWQAQELAFLDLLGEAASVAETVEIRRELSTIQQTIEQLKGRIRLLDDRTGYSTITLDLGVVGAASAAPKEGGPSLGEAWEKAIDAGVNVVGGTLIVLGVLLPLAVIAGVAGGLVWLGVRRRRAVPAAA